MKNALRYFREKNIKELILVLLIVVNLVIVIVGFALLCNIPGADKMSVSDTLWESMKILFDPASVLSLKLTYLARAIVSILVLIGMISFTGGVIGYVTNIITDSIANSRHGNHGVSYDGATLFLNWNECAMDIIIDHLCDRKRSMKDDYIVILTTEDKISVEDEIRGRIDLFKERTTINYNKKEPKIIVRTGNPESAADLFYKVKWIYADSIFIFRPRNVEDADYHVIKTYLCLANEIDNMAFVFDPLDDDNEESSDVVVAVELSDGVTDDAIRNYELGGYSRNGKSLYYETQTFCESFDLGRIYGRVALMPGLAESINQMLSISGSRLIRKEFEEDANETIAEELDSLKYAIPIYDFECEVVKFRVYLSSEEDEKHNNNSLEREEHENVTLPSSFEYSPNFSFDTHTIIIVGLNNKIHSMLECFIYYNQEYPKDRVNVVLVVTGDYERTAHSLIKDENYSDLFADDSLVVIDNWYDIDGYIEYIDEDMHSLVVLSCEESNECRMDKNVLETWVRVSGAAKDDEEFSELIKDKVVLEIKNSSNQELLKDEFGRKIMIGNSFLSFFIEQVVDDLAFYDMMMDMLCGKNDDFADTLWFNKCDLKSIRAGKLFGVDEDRLYVNKRDFIRAVYYGTKRKIMPLGIVRDGTTYLFTNGKSADYKSFDLDERPSLSNAILMSEDERCVAEDLSDEGLIIKADDLVTVIVITS